MNFADEILNQVDNYVVATLSRIGNKMRADIVKNIRDNDKIAWRTLINSIAYNVLKPNATTYMLEIGTNAPHAKYVHEGREPGSMPPVNAIKEWLKKKGGRYRKTGFAGMSARPGADELNSTAWRIALAIKRNGIKPFPFMKVALNQNESFIKAELERLADNLAKAGK